ncbi:hypothetical protein BGZ70_006308 [Mortierella alpina]|uniref:Ndc10 domain-containing protein n=1 Tax=Mortierella alpina TaxID=64518 RepID=A0A9P6M350_MORAP|nr:hypothetical protein BGZ70_006308 [Mortierella alpina]
MDLGGDMFALAFRHRDYLRCSVAAFAFYMFERFQVEDEPLPDFSNAAAWDTIGGLVSGSLQDRVKLKESTGATTGPRASRTFPISKQSLTASTAAINDTCKIEGTRFEPRYTRMGRYSGSHEAFELGMTPKDINRLGRWTTPSGRLQSRGTALNPVNAAFCLAHYKDTEPYIIERDCVAPPLSLQRLIFPWIEHSFANDMPAKTEAWIKECDRAMLGVDSREPKTSKYWDPETKWTKSKNPTNLMRTTLDDRMGFLMLLVRMRRVILQDAVLYLKPDDKGRNLSNALFTSKQANRDIFESAAFQSFQGELLRKMNPLPAVPQPSATTAPTTLPQASLSGTANAGVSSSQRVTEALVQAVDQLMKDRQAMRDNMFKVDRAMDILVQLLAQGNTSGSLDSARLTESLILLRDFRYANLY